MTIKGVIFDFNGTLFFDTHLHNQAWDTFLERYGIELTDQEKFKKLHGKNNPAILRNLFGAELSLTEIEAFSKEKEIIYQTLCSADKMELAPGAIAFFKWLKKREIPFTIATSSDSFNVDFYFRELDLGRYFDHSKVVYSDGHTPSKPDPAQFLEAMEVLNTLPENTVIFEDSPSGIQAAENAHAGKIIIVDSAQLDLQKWDYPIISSFKNITQLFTEGAS